MQFHATKNLCLAIYQYRPCLIQRDNSSCTYIKGWIYFQMELLTLHILNLLHLESFCIPTQLSAKASIFKETDITPDFIRFFRVNHTTTKKTE